MPGIFLMSEKREKIDKGNVIHGARTESPMKTNAVGDVKGSEAGPTIVTLYW